MIIVAWIKILEIRDFSMEIGVPDRKQGTIFVPIPIEIISYDSERLARNFIFIFLKALLWGMEIYFTNFI